MKLYFLISTLYLCLFQVNGQTISSFEEISIPPTQNFINNAGTNGYFGSGNVLLPNYYDTQFQYWEGWSISKETDNQTLGYTNQYSSISGSGYNNSMNYAVGYPIAGNYIGLTGAAKGGVVNGLYVTNSTYTYYSMKFGDAFAKRFGGETGDDPDFLKLTIKSIKSGQVGVDSIDFYLADFRFNNNAQDYLVDEWKYVDLTHLGNVDSLFFMLSSSDNGIFGMNTPAYFCVDDISTSDISVLVKTNEESQGVKIYPNPANDYIIVSIDDYSEKMVVRVLNYCGDILDVIDVNYGKKSINLENYSAGLYFLELESSSKKWLAKVIKQH